MNELFEPGVRKQKLEAVKFWWKRKHFEEAGSRSELGSIWLFEEPGAETFFIKHGASASSNVATILGIKYNKLLCLS